MTAPENHPLNPEWFIEVKNSNEQRVLTLLPEVLAVYPEYPPKQRELCDIYACALNKLPARYQQPGSAAKNDIVTDELIRDVIETAIITVLIRPRSDRSTVMLKREASEKRHASSQHLPTQGNPE